MRAYKITARRAFEQLGPTDGDYDVEGEYEIMATDKESALDLFHETVPISVLENFWIDIKRSDIAWCDHRAYRLRPVAPDAEPQPWCPRCEDYVAL